jgi:hypothetical protein
MADVPLAVHSFDVEDLHVVASYWRRLGHDDTWRIEAYQPAEDTEGVYYLPLLDLTADIPADMLAAAEADRRKVAGVQRSLAAPHLKLAGDADAQAVAVAGLVALLAEVGAPEPAVPIRTPEAAAPAGPNAVIEAPRIRDPAATLPGQVGRPKVPLAPPP